MSSPFFSIITPTYNRADTIGSAIESVLKQDFSDFEYIIVDDGSTDHTQQQVKSYEDARIRYFKKPNGERGAARNFGILKAEGKYICFLDSDDIYYDDHLSKARQYISENNTVKFLYQPYEILLKSGKKIPQEGFYEEGIIKRISYNNFLCPIGAVIRMDIARKYLFDEDPEFNIAEDLYVWLKIGIRHGIKFSDSYTSCLIEHKGRTMENIDPDRLIYCTYKLDYLLNADEEFCQRQDLIRLVQANHLSLSSLYFSIGKKKSKAIKYLIKSSMISFRGLFRKRTLVIIRNLLLTR